MRNTRGPVFVLALCAAIGLGVLLAFWLDRGQPRPPRVSERGAAEDPRAARGEPARLDGSPAPAGRIEAATEPGSTPGTERAAVAPALPLGELTGRVIGPDGQPLAGARVTLARGEGREFTVLDTGPLDEEREIAAGLTDEAGAFRFPLALGTPVDVRAALTGYADALHPDAYAGQELELVLTRGALVFGRITRARDGSPVEAARVRVFRVGGPASVASETTSGPDGSYELSLTFREGATLEVVPELEQCPEWAELTIGHDDRCEHDVVVADGITVEGRVTAADTGLPIAGATVGEGWWYRRTATTDARGEYRLLGFGDPGVLELGARARGYTPEKIESLPAAVDGVMRVDFALRRARAVRGRVVDTGGAPVPEVYVAAVASEFGAQGQRTDWVSTRTDAGGRYEIGDLSTDLGHALFLAKHGYATEVYDFPEREFTSELLELDDIVLREPALLGGRVEDMAQHGLAGVQVELSGSNHDRGRFTTDRRVLGRAASYVDSRQVLTDAEGRFWFGALPAGSYQLRTRAKGRPESAPRVLAIGDGERREDLVLRMDTGGTIRGQVVDDRGQALSGVYVSGQSERLLDPGVAPPGNVSVRTAPDGLFELQGLPEGEYTLRAYPLDVTGADPSAPWLPATVEHVSTAGQPVRIQLPRGASIRGRVVDAGGAPLFGYVVATVDGQGDFGEFGTSDAQGRFALSVLRGSTWNLEVRGPAQTEGFQTVFLTREDVAAGTQDLLLQLQP